MRTAVETEANRVGAKLVGKHPGKSNAIQFAVSEGTDTQQGWLWTTDAVETHYDAVCRAVKTDSDYDFESGLWVKRASHSAFVTYRTQRKSAQETRTGFWTKIRRGARKVLVSGTFLGALAYLIYGRKLLKDELGMLVWPLRGLYIISFLYVLVLGLGFFIFYGLDWLCGLYEKLLPNRVPHYGGIEECKKAAISGDARAQCTLAGAYERGRFGLPQDYAESAKWYQKAAEKNDHGAQLNLGVCLAEGRGVERDVVEGLMWVLLANFGSEKGYLFRDAAHQWVNRLEAQMTEQQIAEARVREHSHALYPASLKSLQVE